MRRLLENGANSSFVHQLADAAVPVPELLISPLRLESNSSLPLPPDLFGWQRVNSTGLDLTVPALRAPLLAAYASLQLPPVPEFDAKFASSALSISATCCKIWSKTSVAERTTILRGAADALQLLHGPGHSVSAALVAAPGVAGVALTGSTEVAKLINRTLAAKNGPIVPLIAETGDINAMLVDSTAAGGNVQLLA